VSGEASYQCNGRGAAKQRKQTAKGIHANNTSARRLAIDRERACEAKQAWLMAEEAPISSQ